MTYILNHKNKKVLSFSTDNQFETKINEIYSPSDVPIILFHDLKEPEKPLYEMQEKINQWLELRTISISRENLKDIFRKLNINNKEELARKNFFLTLSDSYWVCEESQSLDWDKINFFDNSFSNYVGQILFEESKNHVQRNLRSPDTTTSGMLNKRWIIDENNDRLLIKKGTGTEHQEPINEVIASIIYNTLQIPHAKYKLINVQNHKEYYSSCKTLASQNVEMIPAFEIAYDILDVNGSCSYKDFLNRCEVLGLENLNEQLAPMFLVDFIIANSDRHLNNICFNRNPNNLEWLGLTPIFDNGNSLFVNYQSWEIADKNPLLQNAKPFAEKHGKQLELILQNDCHAFDKVDLSSLSDIHNDVNHFIEPLKRLSTEKKQALSEYIKNQVTLSKKIIVEHNPKMLVKIMDDYDRER